MVGETPLRVPQVAEQLGVTEDTVRRWLHSGRLRGTFIGGRRGYLILPSDVRQFVEDNRRQREESDGE